MVLWRGRCHLGLGIPTGGKWADINTLDELRRLPSSPARGANAESRACGAWDTPFCSPQAPHCAHWSSSLA